MKKIFLVLSVLFLLENMYGLRPQCPILIPGSKDIILIADPTCCNRFFVCEDGVAIPKMCPDGLYYDSNHQLCTWVWEPDGVFDCEAYENADQCPPVDLPEVEIECDRYSKTCPFIAQCFERVKWGPFFICKRTGRMKDKCCEII